MSLLAFSAIFGHQYKILLLLHQINAYEVKKTVSKKYQLGNNFNN